MKKKGLIVVNAFKVWPPIKYMCERLTASFAKLDVKIDVLNTIEVSLLIDNDGGVSSKELNYDFAIFLDKDIYIAKLIEQSGIKVFNSPAAIEICDDKIKTFIALADKGIRMPKTIISPLNYSNEINNTFLEYVCGEIGLPLVAKINYGSQGNNVRLINSIEELYKLEKEWQNYPHHFEEFISSSKGKDYRLILINHECVATMLRTNETGDFRSNIAVGGTACNIKMPKAFIFYAENISKILNLDYCGIDLLINEKGEPILCEVNSNAFFQAIESVSNIDIAQKYADYIFSTIY